MATLYNTWAIVDLKKRDPETGSPLFWTTKKGWIPLQCESIYIASNAERNKRMKNRLLPKGEDVKWIRMSDAITLYRNWMIASSMFKS